MRRLRFILLALSVPCLLAACDSADDTGIDDGGEETPKRTVLYEVFGTYRTCAIEYRDADGTDVNLGEIALDWSDSVKVDVDREFLARVTATCADIERPGKATLRLWVDGLIVDSDDVLGFGDSGMVQRLLQPIG